MANNNESRRPPTASRRRTKAAGGHGKRTTPCLEWFTDLPAPRKMVGFVVGPSRETCVQLTDQKKNSQTDRRRRSRCSVLPASSWLLTCTVPAWLALYGEGRHGRSHIRSETPFLPAQEAGNLGQPEQLGTGLSWAEKGPGGVRCGKGEPGEGRRG